MITALLDIECALYKLCYGCGSLVEATDRTHRYVDGIVADVRADRLIVCLSDPSRTYWRHDILWSYKSGRPDRPEFIVDVLDAIRETYPTRCLPGLEADDVAGILATCPQVRGDRVVVSDDKDMLTVPGQLYRPAKRQRLIIDAREAAARHLMQTLTGDSADSYGGCPGVGPKRAAAIVRLIDPPERQWQAVVAAYVAAGLTEADAVLQARLARILWADDYDFEARAVRLWNPPAHVLDKPEPYPTMGDGR